jgi:glycerophosphoryl diester phosphodiesterase
MINRHYIEKFVIPAALTIFLSLFLLECSSMKIKNKPIDMKIDLQGHRGARGLRPENTIPAFIYAIKQNITTLELDVNLTKDKKLIIHHDSEINPAICVDENYKPAKSVAINTLTVDEIKKLDCGFLKNPEFPLQVTVKNTKLITLTEFFEFILKYESENKITPEKLFNIELKFGENYTKNEIKQSVSAIINVLNKFKMINRTTVQSFVHEALIEVKNIDKSIKISALFKPSYFKGFKMLIGFDSDRGDIIKKALKIKADIISPYYLYASPEFIQKCHKNNLKVIIWTVNKEKDMIKYFNTGIDGIISDYPDRLKKVFDKWSKTK